MKKTMNYLIKYWAQITGGLFILSLLFGWCWRLASKYDSLLNTVSSYGTRLDDHDNQLKEHDSQLDEHDHRLIPLEKVEDLREKGLMK
jgi:hypothetical protein